MIQALGWIGSGLVVASLVHNRPLPFRLINLASAIVLLVFNLAIGLWSMVALNSVILIVNLWHLRALTGRHRPESAPAVHAPSVTRSAASDRAPINAAVGVQPRNRRAIGPTAPVRSPRRARTTR